MYKPLCAFFTDGHMRLFALFTDCHKSPNTISPMKVLYILILSPTVYNTLSEEQSHLSNNEMDMSQVHFNKRWGWEDL